MSLAAVIPLAVTTALTFGTVKALPSVWHQHTINHLIHEADKLGDKTKDYSLERDIILRASQEVIKPSAFVTK